MGDSLCESWTYGIGHSILRERFRFIPIPGLSTDLKMKLWGKSGFE